MKGGFQACYQAYCNRVAQLKRDSSKTSSDGFTITETLIVLAVTGLLFMTAVLLVAGKQRYTEFDQAIRSVQSEIQQAVNEVSTGHYANRGNFQCAAGGSGPVISAASGVKQGTNEECIFLGKVLQFKINGASPEQIRVYTLAGLRAATTGKEVTSISEAKPKVIAPTTTQSDIPDNSNAIPLQYGLTILKMEYGTAANVPVGAFAVTSSLTSYTNGAIVSGSSQQLTLTPIETSVLNASAAAGAQTINDSIAASAPNPAEGIRICFVSGGTNQSGLITIGNNGQHTVTLAIKANKTCL